MQNLFLHWHQFKSGEISWESFQSQMQSIREEVNRLLLRGRCSGNQRLVGMCRELYNHREWLWTFIEVQGIEPTNNATERALRPAVIYRKLSFGTQSEAGGRVIERMLTVSEICRLQKRSVFQWLTAAAEANLNNHTARRLLPLRERLR